MYTKLGENISEASQAQEVADHYLELLGRIQAAEVQGEISVKPTQLGPRHRRGPCAWVTCARSRPRPRRRARTSGSTWRTAATSTGRSTCTSACARRTRGPAICLQAYLKRTAKDVERLLPLGPAIRLVKGAYDEPAAIAFRSKKEVDANYLGLAITLIRESRNRPVRLGLGTHDVELIEQIASHAAAAGVRKDGFEVEMLYGIRAKEQRRLAKAGYKVQVLIAYGAAWYPWYMRRLAERPANVLFALRQLLPG